MAHAPNLPFGLLTGFSSYKLPTDTVTFWSVIGVAVIFAGAAVAAIRRAWQAPSEMHKAYDQDRRRAKSAIEANQAVPELAALIDDVTRPLMTLGDPIDKQTIEARLLSFGSFQSLKRLAELYRRYTDIDRLWGDALKWAKWKGFTAGGFLAILAALLLWFIFNGFLWPWWILLLAALGAVSASLSASCWFLEISVHNQLTRIFEQNG